MLTDYLVPLLLLGISLAALGQRRDGYGILLEGAGQGLVLIRQLLPTLVLLLTAVTMFQASGAGALLGNICAPLFSRLGIPPETAVLILIRPISGSAALAVGAQLMEQYGVDSRVGITAAVMLGASETTFYTVSVYFGAIGVKRTRYAIPAALTADCAAFLAAGWSTRLLFPEAV